MGILVSFQLTQLSRSSLLEIADFIVLPVDQTLKIASLESIQLDCRARPYIVGHTENYYRSV
jgi:hypothetical protein